MVLLHIKSLCKRNSMRYTGAFSLKKDRLQTPPYFFSLLIQSICLNLLESMRLLHKLNYLQFCIVCRKF